MRFQIASPIISWVLLAPTAAVAIPPGSYQQTCRDIGQSGNTLSAGCKNRGGSWVATSLGDVHLCIGDIGNADGQLTCSKGSPPPPGSYAQTCRDISVAGNTLRATCKNKGGNWGGTTLPGFSSCIGDIANFDGRLSCSKGSPPPAGSYAQTCQEVTVNGSTLSARCRARNGSWRRTELAGFKSCVSDIGNLNGFLQCSKGGSPPPGSYRLTCRDVFVENGTLKASCKDGHGDWNATHLAAYPSCAGDITNLRGFLSCTPRGLPAGSYQQSCRNLTFAAGTLTGTCREPNGSWSTSTLAGVSSCRAGIINVYGHLTCPKGSSGPPAGSYQRTCHSIETNANSLSATCLKRNGSWQASVLRSLPCNTDIANKDGVLTCALPAPPPTPVARGASKVLLFNCTAKKRVLHIWLFDPGAGWREASSLPPQYDASGRCPGTGFRPLAIPLASGRQQIVMVVDPRLTGCGSNDPQKFACQKQQVAVVGAENGPPLDPIIVY